MKRRNKKKGIEITSWKVEDADDFQNVDAQEAPDFDPIPFDGAMKYPSLPKPTDPGFYWLAEAGEEPHLVEVCIESDSHNMFYVLIPGDEQKHPLDLWSGALWFGPLKKEDLPFQ